MLFIFPKKGGLKRANGDAYHPRQKQIELLLKPNDKIRITGKLNRYYLDYEATGSEFNEQLSQLRKKYIEGASEAVMVELQIDSLQATAGDQEAITQLFQKRIKVEQVFKTAQIDFVKSHPNEDLSAYFLMRQPLDTVGKYYSTLSSTVQQGVLESLLKSQLIRYKKFIKAREAEEVVKEGSIVPDFTLKSMDGKDFTLNSVEAGYTVLDFWGSWCQPCIKGFPRMKEYHTKYKNQIEFIGVACNDTEDQWKETVEKHELPWAQVIENLDVSNIDKDLSANYGVQVYPTKFLLDKNKRVIAKFEGEDDSFYERLDELMAKR